MQKIAVIGAGYVGLTTAAGLAHVGHDVVCTDVDARKITTLCEGGLPIVEKGLAPVVRDGVAAGRLRFGTDNVEAAVSARFVFLCVPTPQADNGAADMSYIRAAATEIGPHLRPGTIVVNKSTVPVGSTKVVEEALGRSDVTVVSNPEFLREGTAVHDFLHPDRIVIGADDEEAGMRVASLFTRSRAPVVLTDPASAETIKYASNAFLAAKVSFVNAIAALCEAVGANVHDVTSGMGLDPRIGAEFLRPGPGWGGSCFPKDAHALVRIAENAGYDFKLLKGAIAANDEQYERVVAKLTRRVGGSLEGATVAQWGLTFKAGTDDTRCSPAIEIARRVAARGATVRAYDPTVDRAVPDVVVVDSMTQACEGADVLFIATEWDDFCSPDLRSIGKVMTKRSILDARNILDPALVRHAGFEYEGIGVA